MKGKIPITIFLFFHLFFQYGIAQNKDIKFNLVENPSGKPFGKITSITQDPSGYMWFAGQGDRCIYRFDGNRMIPYSQDSLNPNSLGSNAIETIYADDSGMIWVGFQDDKGLDKYDPATEIFHHYRHADSISGSLGAGMVFVILRDHQGRLWVGTSTGLDRLDEKTGKFIHYKNEQGNPKSLSSNIVRTIYEDHKGVVWIGTGFQWDNEHPDDGGLNRLEPDGTFTRFLHNPNDPHSLINNKVRAIFEDSRGNFWVGTSGDGLHTMDRETGRFERHLYDPAKPEKLSRPALSKGNFGDHITFIREDGIGDIWIGTEYEGISRYDTQTKQITHYEFGNGFPDRSGWGAFTSRDGVLWISTEQNHLFRVDPFLKNIYDKNIGAVAFCFHEENNGTLWVGTDGLGLQQYDQNKKLIHQYNVDASDSFSLFSNEVYFLKQDQEDSIWLGTRNGIGTFNKLTRRFNLLNTGTKNADFFNTGSVAFFQGKDGLKWFGTVNGLIRYNLLDNSIKQYLPDTKNSGSISAPVITSVLEDEGGAI